MKNSVKITSGKFRGREILTPGGGTHPMGERERLAVFNMIAEILPGARVLDAYAGSGALGIEALSRGAQACDFIEKNTEAARIIRDTLARLGLTDTTTVIKSSVADFETEGNFDAIIADPPYDHFNSIEVERLAKYLKSGGTMVVSCPNDNIEISGLQLEKSRRYARAHILIFTK